MRVPSWYRERNDRTLRYAGRVLQTGPPDSREGGRKVRQRYDGQVAALVATNLLARMTPALTLDIPDTEMVPPLPWAASNSVII